MDAVAGQPPAEDASRSEALHALLRRDLIDPFKLVGSDIGPQSLAVLVCTAAQCGMDDEAGELAAKKFKARFQAIQGAYERLEHYFLSLSSGGGAGA